MLKLIKLIIVVIIFCGIVIQPTYSSLIDTELSTGNSFSATTLDFSLDGAGVDITGMKPGDSQTKTFKIKKDGLSDFKYQLLAEQTSGDTGLCTALQIEAKLDGLTMYSGGLLGLTFLPQTILGNWEYKISLADGSSSIQNKSCNFNLKVKGWQTDSNGTWGLGDEEILTNSVTSGDWTDFGDVVINEVMWMGSTDSTADEWIELRNTTGNSIDLTGWKIATITLSGNIPANGYFLLSNYQTTSSAINDSISSDQVSTALSLDNGGEQLTLKSNLDVSIDQTSTGSWAAGTNGTDKQSMERNDDPTTGWHTCTDSACNSGTYWDTAGGNNYGTPKAANLSQNDPSSPEYVPPVGAVLELSLELSASPSATATSSGEVIL